MSKVGTSDETHLNLIVNFASAKMMGEFRTQNIRGNVISRCEKEQTVEQNHVYLRIFPPVSKSSVLGLHSAGKT